MPSFLVPLVLLLAALTGGEQEVRAQWRCEPAEVELGEPFELVLELTHPATLASSELSKGELALDGSWVVLAELAPETTRLADGSVQTRKAWRVASLEPGERSLADALSSVVLSEQVARIQVGKAVVRVSGVLGEGEDEPRPMHEFPEDFAGDEAQSSGPPWGLWISAVALLAAVGTGLFLWRRARARRARNAPPVPLERLGELEAGLEQRDGQESCYALTRLLREAADGLRKKPREGLSDEEWLAEVTASLEIPRGTMGELGAVLERTAEIKYAGGTASPWALKEIFVQARAALEGLTGGAGGARA